jgi:hypothetical protein
MGYKAHTLEIFLMFRTMYLDSFWIFSIIYLVKKIDKKKIIESNWVNKPGHRIKELISNIQAIIWLFFLMLFPPFNLKKKYNFIVCHQ